MGSKTHRPDHKNPWTGELLENKVQICSSCHKNFGTTEAGDSHRVGLFESNRRCLNPSEVDLIPIENKHGATVWRLPEWS